jgi:predicted transcriptional regulator YdeE
MNKQSTTIEKIKLVGMSTITNNANEMNKDAAKIPKLIDRYFNEKISDKIINKKDNSQIHFVYTNYESNHTENYTYFIGEEVNYSIGILS